jgi:hypothetical protein
MTDKPDRREFFQTLAVAGGAAAATGRPTDIGAETVPGHQLADFAVGEPGAVRRTVDSKLQDTVSIADFGATVGQADNAPMIERALSAAMKRGRALQIPAGVFRYSQINFGKNDTAKPSRLIISGPGTLRSTTPGISMVAMDGPFYDLVLDGVRFESEAGAGTCLIDGDRFIRLIFTPGVQISNFDWVIRGDHHLQSIRMIGCIIRGGRGAVVKAPMAYDCTFAHNIIEFVTDGIVIDGDNNPAVNTCRIDSNVIEGIGGRAIVLGSCLATTVCGNYFEMNTGGDVYLDAGSAPHKGLKVQSNSFQMSDARIAKGEFAICWGRSTALPVLAGGNFTNGRLHDTAGVSSVIDMNGDYAAVELYRGHKTIGATDRAPQGQATFSDGLAHYFTWSDRYLALDPYRNEIRFAGKRTSLVSGKREPPVMTFSEWSPQDQPGNFDRKTWARGSVVFNLLAASGRPAGWVCVAEGLPGRWLPFAPLS